MDIESLLTEKDIQEIKARAKDQLMKQVVAFLNPGQVAAEIRNDAIKQAVQEVSAKVFRDKYLQESLSKAVNTAENRINARLHKMLSEGIKVSFANIGEAQ